MYRKVESWFDANAMEEKILSFWREKEIFEKLVHKNRNGKPWSFLDGPITANNSMGIHHAWGRSLKDAFQRYHAMNGRKLRYQNGYDSQGLWVEVEVEKEIGLETKKDIEKYGIPRFVEACKDRVRRYSRLIMEESQRLGQWMDWENSYYTMSDGNNYAIWAFLKKCHEKRLIYKGHDVMPWCPRCGTGISQHEMQEGYHETEHPSLTVSLPVRDKPDQRLMVWTTTPWTLTSNVALAVHPELSYVLAEQNGRRYYLAKKRAGAVLSAGGPWKTVEELSGSTLLAGNLSYHGPFDELDAQREGRDRHILLPWKEVSDSEGTGIVHIAPGCGGEDFLLGKEHGLPVIAPIDEAGIFQAGFGPFSGKAAADLAEDVETSLREKGMLYHVEPYLHSYPHCWRCDTELLFRLVDEWFIRMDPWRKDIMKAAGKARWIPGFGLGLELDWLTNMRDWMISKKRYWGLALPIWECRECGRFDVIGSREELETRALEGWQAFQGHSPHKPWIDEVRITCPGCGKPASRIADVGNPWLDAGIVAYSTVRYWSDRSYWQRWIPADLILECFPGQYRLWFYSLLTMSTMMEGLCPFKTVVGHANVRDEKGEEMHKSKGNAIWFADAVKQTGADIIRWLFFEHELASNINFSFKTARQLRGKFINTLWNCYAFYTNYARLAGFAPSFGNTAPSVGDTAPSAGDSTWHGDFDRWLISRLHLLIRECRHGFDDYDIRTACRAITGFVEDLSNWYIRHNRRRFWKIKGDDRSTAEFEALYRCLSVLIRLLAPLIPFLAEEMYQNLERSWNPGAPESVHLTPYPTADMSKVDGSLVADMDVVMALSTTVLSARQEAGIKTRQPLPRLTVCSADSRSTAAIRRFEAMLMEDLNIKNLEIRAARSGEPPEGALRPVSGEPEIRTAPWKDGYVLLDTRLTEDLVLEGFMREFLRKAQVLRKKLSLQIEDRIRIQYRTASNRLKEVMSRYQGYLSQELLCVEWEENIQLKTGNTIKINGEEILTAVSKAG